jgi:hypothetical protein
MLLALLGSAFGSFCNRYRTGGFAALSALLLPSLPRVRVCWRSLFPSAIATAGLAWDYIFYFH